MRDALGRARSLDYLPLIANTLFTLGIFSDSPRKETREFFEEAVEIYRTLGRRHNVARCLRLCVWLAGDIMESEQKERHFQEALEIYKAIDDVSLAASCCDDLAEIYTQRGDGKTAKYYQGLSKELSPCPGTPPSAASTNVSRMTLEGMRATMRTRLHGTK